MSLPTISPSHFPYAPGLVIAAPASGSGKTVITLALLRAFARSGLAVASAKAGPDYIDPAFHAAASGRESVNLDAHAMRGTLIDSLAREQASGANLLLVEGVMGLFDGAADGSGSTADLAAHLGFPVVLVVDAARQSHSVAALVRGFRDHRDDVQIAGVILNRVGSERHAAMLSDALAKIGMPVFGAVTRDPTLALPERHLGLVQAGEREDLEAFLDTAATRIETACDLAALHEAARQLAPPGEVSDIRSPIRLEPFGQRIAVARDVAFAFAYPHLLEGWRQSGAELSFFSPLADEPPCEEADAVYLPGGYPELHAARLAAADGFREGMRAAVARGAVIYGECGGYMTLGEELVDGEGVSHRMLGLLPLATSFATRRRHLGYRHLDGLSGAPLAGSFTAHEWHYASILHEGAAERLFQARDATGADLGALGLRVGAVMGSFCHLIDRG